MTWSYKDAGVDIDAGNALVDRIKPLAKSTFRPEVLSSLGGFAGLCAIPTRYRDPVLVSSTDGVGTKLKTAFETQVHNTVGIDLVAMCVNDALVTGAEPLFFLDYFACGKLDVVTAEAVIQGIADGCRQSGCALLGGETAELPGMYKPGEYDLAGFCVAVAERSEIRTGESLRVGDCVIGLASSGLHSNGHSLARKVFLEVAGLALEDCPDLLGGHSLGDEMLRPTRIYKDAFSSLAQSDIRCKAAAHITGGGLVENPPRMLANEDLAIRLQLDAWPRPAIFALLAQHGVDESELRRTFNLGIGMLLVVDPKDTARALTSLTHAGEAPFVVGEIVERAESPVVFA